MEAGKLNKRITLQRKEFGRKPSGQMVGSGWMYAPFGPRSTAPTARRLTPVSYTHLDVYKRQAIPCEEDDMDKKQTRRRMDYIGSGLMVLGCLGMAGGLWMVFPPGGVIWLGGWAMALGFFLCRAAGRDSG